MAYKSVHLELRVLSLIWRTRHEFIIIEIEIRGHPKSKEKKTKKKNEYKFGHKGTYVHVYSPNKLLLLSHC